MNKVLIIGAGKSGRGMLADLYQQAGYKIVFADKDVTLLNHLRTHEEYSIELTNWSTNETSISRVSNYEVINVKEKENYYRAMEEACIISTAIMAEDFDSVIDDLVGYVRYALRKDSSKEVLITLGANYVGMKEYFLQQFREKLDKVEFQYFTSHITLLASIVNRKNMLPKKLNPDKPLDLIGDTKDTLQVEECTKLRNLRVYPDFFVERSTIEQLLAVKLWAYNVVQASMVAVGVSKGYVDTYECASDSECAEWAYYAAIEGYTGVQKQFALKERSDLENREMVQIFQDPNNRDSCARIIKSPIRKLGKNDRFIGSALCCIKNGVLPYYIAKCCAYMFLYADQHDSESLELHEYLQDKGIEETIIKYCHLDVAKPNEKLLYDLLRNSFYEIDGENPLYMEK